MLNNLLTNWKTTSAGLIMIIGSVVHLIYTVRDYTATEQTWTVSLTAILGGVGLIFAGDSNKSASKEDVKSVQTQISNVPQAINSGDTTMLSKSIQTGTDAAAGIKPQQPIKE